jgi:hypothetical protein
MNRQDIFLDRFMSIPPKGLSLENFQISLPNPMNHLISTMDLMTACTPIGHCGGNVNFMDRDEAVETGGDRVALSACIDGERRIEMAKTNHHDEKTNSPHDTGSIYS